MDCVGCDKCRLWGKVQTTGYGAALKILFEFDETKNGENPHLGRTELVALVNTLARVSHSIDAIQKFREAVNTGDHGVLHIKGPLRTYKQNQASSRPGGSKENPKTITYAEKEADFDDYDDLDEDPYASPSEPRKLPTFSESFYKELDLVWRAYKMVMRSWWEMPFKLFAIFVTEMSRLWNFWLGLPVPERSWGFHFPTRDEL
jgi:hypothetical protein